MLLTDIKTYGDSHQGAFESLSNQLFARWCKRAYADKIKHFAVINGTGGDGGIEAYALLTSGKYIGIQSKWFPKSITSGQISQIRKSIDTALKVRPNIVKYIICVPSTFHSEKIGKGKKPVKNTEEGRIQGLLDWATKKYASTHFHIWNSTSILDELQIAGNEGILKFWFEKEELTLNLLKDRFDLAKAGWLADRYVPDLHVNGSIHQQLSALVFDEKFRKELAFEFSQILSGLKKILRLLKNFKGTNKDARKIKSEIEQACKVSSSTLNNLSDQMYLGIPPMNISVPLQPIPSRLNEISNAKPSLEQENTLTQLIKAIQSVNDKLNQDVFKELQLNCLPHNLIILGQACTGKTHGIARFVESQLKKELPTIVINANSYSAKNWGTILRQVLGGLNNWNEEEIFTGLEAAAFRTDSYRVRKENKKNPFKQEPTMVLICVDGLDEAASKEWTDRINETEVISQKFPRIRFTAASRSYPSTPNPLKLKITQYNKVLPISPLGDTHIKTLIPKYLDEYNINYEQARWVLDAFEDALTLRLFCEQHTGGTLPSTAGQVMFDLRSQLIEKIRRIESDFKKSSNRSWSEHESVFKKVIGACVKLFLNSEKIPHTELTKLVIETTDRVVDRPTAGLILDALCNNGILQRTDSKDQALGGEESQYGFTFRSYLDYFISEVAVNEIITTGSKKMPSIISEQNGFKALELTAIALFNDHDIMVGEKGYWEDDLSIEGAKSLKFTVLAQSSTAKIQSHLPDLKARFESSVEGRNEILEHFILPNLFRTDLNLGITFIHDVLSSYVSTYERDKFWSGPAKYDNTDQVPNIGLILYQARVQNHHKYNQLPLLLAWSLSTTNTLYLEHGLTELTRWAQANLSEYIKLLDTMFNCGDPQIKEGLATVTFGVSSLVRASNSGMKELAIWVARNIFDHAKITHNKNAVVRHGMRMAVERAYLLNEISKKEVMLARPPYHFDPAEHLPLDFSGKSGTRDERSPIVHDLAWYVIKKSYEGFLDFRNPDLTHTNGKNFLQSNGARYGRSFGPIEYAIAAAIPYIKNLGWNNPSPPGMTEESGGSRSKHTTFEEKYTWLAVHEIMGYLSDRLPFKSDTNMISDYVLMLDVFNPASKLKSTGAETDFEILDGFYIPEDLWPRLIYAKNNIKSAISKWVRSTKQPSFKKWIHLNNASLELANSEEKWITLYSHSHFKEPSQVCRAGLEVICCLIEQSDFSKFIKGFKVNSRRWKRMDFDHLENQMASPKVDSYASAEDFLWMQWIQEEEPTLTVYSESKDFILKKCVTKILGHSTEGGESHVKVPSRLLSTTSHVSAADGPLYLDKKGQAKSFFSLTGDSTFHEQEILAFRQEDFFKILTKNKLSPFWIVKLYRSTVPGQNDDSHTQNSKFWIVWGKDLSKSFKYHDGYFANADD